MICGKNIKNINKSESFPLLFTVLRSSSSDSLFPVLEIGQFQTYLQLRSSYNFHHEKRPQ